MASINKPSTPTIDNTQLSVTPVEGATVYKLYSVVHSAATDIEYYDGSYTISSTSGGSDS